MTAPLWTTEAMQAAMGARPSGPLPPSISGRAAVKASSASWLALRLATVSPLLWAATMVSKATWWKSAGSSPFMRRVNSSASFG